MSDDKQKFSRRALLKATAAAGLLASTPSWARAPVPRRVLHIAGHSHIDAAWLWAWRDGADTVLTTFRSALNRMAETPGFCFSHSSAQHYRWVERADPGMFEEIRARIREGRWEVIGGWPVEPDCNLPAAESFVRHCLYGKAYLKRALGVDVKIGFNPDSFGHAAGLPTILKRAGYGYYLFERPSDWDSDPKLPWLFWWEGPDGSRVLAARIWTGFNENQEWVGGYDADTDAIVPAAKNDFAPGFDHGLLFLGVGDHGGAITKQQIAKTLELAKEPALPELRWSTLAQFFAAVEASPAYRNLPVVRGELQHHARGCYSANGAGKQLNRRAERALVQAETAALFSHRAAGHAYPAAEYAEAWWKVAFNQFHDLMAGTALYSDYQDSRDSLGWVCETAQISRVEALQVLARRVDTTGVEEGAVFLYNPLPWPRKALVEFHTINDPQNTGSPTITHLASRDGAMSPIQWRPSDSMTPFVPKLSAWVDLPACGYKVFELAHGTAPQAAPWKESFAVSDTGFGLSSLKADDGTELLAGAISLVVIADSSDTWGHGATKFRREIGRPTLVWSALIEDGPVTRVTRQRARWNNSEIVLDIAQFAGQDGVELRFVIDWHEREQMLKLEIPSALAQPQVHAKVPAAVVRRACNGDEEPYQDWAAVQGRVQGRDYTLAVLNDSTYSYDCEGGLFRTVLIRSAPYARHEPSVVPANDINAWQDQGRQERRFWLLAARGTHEALALDRRAEEVQTPTEHVMDAAHAGSEPWTRSYLEISPSNVWVLAVKRAEDGEGSIIRVQERSGRATTARVVSSLLGLDQQVALAPWELKTLRVGASVNGRAQLGDVSLLET